MSKETHNKDEKQTESGLQDEVSSNTASDKQARADFSKVIDTFEDDLDSLWGEIMVGAGASSVERDELSEEEEDLTQEMVSEDYDTLLPQLVSSQEALSFSAESDVVSEDDSDAIAYDEAQQTLPKASLLESEDDAPRTESEGDEISLQSSEAEEIDEKEEKEEGEKDEDSDKVSIRLSARAKAGVYYPEAEPLVVETTIRPNFLYDLKDCEGGWEAEERRQFIKRSLRRLAIALVVLLVLGIIGIGVYHVFRLVSEKPVDFAQHYRFVDSISHLHTISSSADGRWFVVCSEGVGTIYESKTLREVASFFPDQGGCNYLSVGDESASVWYLGSRGYISHFNPLETSVLGERRGRLQKRDDIIDFREFGGGFSYLTGEAGSYFWHHQSYTGESSEQSLSSDAILCSQVGRSEIEFSYISQGHLMWESLDGGGKIDISKQNGSVITCALNREKEEWLVLTSLGQIYLYRADTIRIIELGRNFTKDDPVTLLANNETIDVLSGRDWFTVNNSGEVKRLSLSESLSLGDDVVQTQNLDYPLAGVIRSHLVFINRDGMFEGLYSSEDEEKPQISAVFFMGNGQFALSVLEDNQSSASKASTVNRIVVWDLRSGRVAKPLGFKQKISSISVSKHGFTGLVEIAMPTAFQIAWLDWMSGEKRGEENTTSALRDVEWSGSETHALLHFEDNSHSLYQLLGAKAEKLRDLNENDLVTFYRDDYLLIWSEGRLRMERISDGLQSVPLLLEKDLGLEKISSFQNMRTQVNSPYLLLWGESGIYRFDMQTETGTWISKESTTWVAFSPSGEYLATAKGIWKLASAQLYRSFMIEGSGRFLWSGDGYHLISNDGKTSYSVTSGERYEMLGHRDMDGVNCLGENCGMHPRGEFVLQRRGMTISLEAISRAIIGIFSGFDSAKWCWMTTNGDVQGVGGVCETMNTQEDETEQISIPMKNETILASLSLEKWPAPKAYQALYELKEVKFQDWTNFSIETTPKEASLLFAASEGELPEPLTKLQNTLTPQTTQLSRDSRWFAVVISKPGYETVIESFQADSKLVNLKVQLIDSQTAAATIKINDTQGEPVTENVEKHEQTIRRSISMVRENLLSCMLETERNKNHDVSMKIDAGGFIEQFTLSNATVNECISTIMSGILLDPDLAGHEVSMRISGAR